MTPIPQDPSGDSGLVQTVKGILRVLREQKVIQDPTVRIERTSQGTKLSVAKGKTGGGGGADDMVWL